MVGPREALGVSRTMALREINWIGDQPLDEGDEIEVFAKVRSTRPPAPATLRILNGKAFVDLTNAETGVAPGQACVFFDGDGDTARVLGGGWIHKTERTGTWSVDFREGEAPVPAA
jgi:tRNA-specific 2-thiouridylase